MRTFEVLGWMWIAWFVVVLVRCRPPLPAGKRLDRLEANVGRPGGNAPSDTGLPIMVGAARRLVIRLRLRRTAAARVGAASTLVEMLRVATASGATPRGALLIVAEYEPGGLDLALGEVASRLLRGESLAPVMSDWVRRSGRSVEEVAHLLVSADDTGVAIGDALERLGVDLRRRRRRDLETRARRLPVTLLVPLVLCILPSFVALAVVPMVAVGLDSFGGPP